MDMKAEDIYYMALKVSKFVAAVVELIHNDKRLERVFVCPAIPAVSVLINRAIRMTIRLWPIH
jgi:hypothetical protein